MEEKRTLTLEEENEELKRQNKNLLIQQELLQEELRKLKDKLFGRRSESWTKEEQLQGLLFNEAELVCGRSRKETVEEPGIPVKSYTRRRGKRKPLPPELPREEIIHDIPEEEKQCACGHEKVVIGREESEKLDIIPMQVKVLKHIRLKYACKHCEGTEEEGTPAVTIAPPAPQLLPKTMATPGLCAYLITSKYCDALPLYRLEKLFSRGGVDLPRETMGRWLIKIASLLSGLIGLLEEAIKQGSVQLMDETRLQVLGEANRSNTSLSFMWVALGGRPATPAVRFMYHQSRSRKIPESWLAGYKGFVQTDGYEGYEAACKEKGIIHVGCFAHARRRFMDALKSSGKSKQAAEALNYIKKLYTLETELRLKSLSPENFQIQRKERAKKIFESFHTWLLHKALTVIPSSLLGKAVFYTLKQWPKLVRYVDSPYLTPDTNAVENAIRPFVVGRKNWLIAGSPRGAHASASLYSIIETAKLNNLEPYWYFRYLLTKLEQEQEAINWEAVIPWNLKNSDLKPG